MLNGTCKICGKILNKKQKSFCSNKCKMQSLTNYWTGRKPNNYKRVERICKFCGKKEMVSPSFADRPYCSRECMAKDYSNRFKGTNHWNWQGGITKDLGRNVLYPGYKEWRKKVYQRDKYKCVLCGNDKSGELQAHHIKPVKSNKELILDVSNGLTVCKKCHREIHYGKNKNQI